MSESSSKLEWKAFGPTTSNSTILVSSWGYARD